MRDKEHLFLIEGLNDSNCLDQVINTNRLIKNKKCVFFNEIDSFFVGRSSIPKEIKKTLCRARIPIKLDNIDTFGGYDFRLSNVPEVESQKCDEESLKEFYFILMGEKCNFGDEKSRTRFQKFKNVCIGMSLNEVFRFSVQLSQLIEEDASNRDIMIKLFYNLKSGVSLGVMLDFLVSIRTQRPNFARTKKYQTKESLSKRDHYRQYLSYICPELERHQDIQCKSDNQFPKLSPKALSLQAKKTKSYVESLSNLQDNPFTAFLFNSKFVSIPIGGESIGGSLSEVDITGIEDYFYRTSHVPDNEVILERIEKSIAYINHRLPEWCTIPKYIDYSLKTIYTNYYDQIQPHHRIYSSLFHSVFLNSIQNVYNRFAVGKTKWKATLEYDNCLFFSSCLHLKSILPMTPISIQDVTSFRSFISAIYSSLSLNPKLIDKFFAMLSIANEIPIYLPKIFCSAIQMIPSLFTQATEYEKWFFLSKGKSFIFSSCIDALFEEMTAKNINSSNERNYLYSDASWVFKALLLSFKKKKKQKNGDNNQNILFSSVSGLIMVTYIERFLSVIEMIFNRADYSGLINHYLKHREPISISTMGLFVPMQPLYQLHLINGVYEYHQVNSPMLNVLPFAFQIPKTVQ